MRVALCQMNIAYGEPHKNLEKMLRMMEVPADLYVFPELSLTGYAGEKLDVNTEDARRELLATGKTLIYGDIRNSHNVAVAVETGKEVGVYRKVHLFSHGGENEFFKSGERYERFQMEDMSILPLICYDLRFPVGIYENSADVHMIVVIANWPMERIEHWLTLLRARSIENQRFVIGVNRVGRTRWIYGGCSCAYDPWGRALNTPHHHEDVILVEVNLEAIEEIKTQFDTRRDERFI